MADENHGVPLRTFLGALRLGPIVLLIALFALAAPRTIRAEDVSLCDGKLIAGEQCWNGSLGASGVGNIYNDFVRIFFNFTVAKSGRVTGKGHATMDSYIQKFADCVVKRTETPSEFDVEIGGQRQRDVFKLKVVYYTPSQVTITAKCTGGTHSSSSAINAFMGVGLASAVNYPNNDGGFYYPVFSHVDDASPADYSFYAVSSGLVAEGSVQIRCVRGCVQRPCGQAPGFVWIEPSGEKAVLYATASRASPVVASPPAGIRLVYREVNDQNNDVWYHIQSAGFDGWAHASDVFCTRPSRIREKGHPPRDFPDPNQRIIESKMAYTASARG